MDKSEALAIVALKKSGAVDVSAAIAAKTAAQAAAAQAVSSAETAAAAAEELGETVEDVAELKTDVSSLLSALSDNAGSYLPNASRSQGYKNLLNLVNIVHGAYYWNNVENAASGFHYGKIPVKAGDVLTLNKCRFGWLKNMSGVGSSAYNGDGPLETITITQDGILYISFSNINPHVCYGSTDVAENYIAEIASVQEEIASVQEEIDGFTDVVQGEYGLTDDDLEWHNGWRYYTGTEYTGGNYDNYHYFYLYVTAGDVISSADDFTQRCEYNGDTVVSATNLTGFTSYTVPAGVTRVALTRGKNKTKVIVFNGQIRTIKKPSLGDLSEFITDTVQDTESLIAPKNTTIFEFSPNLVNPDTEVIGEFVSQTNGTFYTSTTQTRSDYIPITGGEQYYLTTIDNNPPGIRYCFYDAYKVYISGVLVPDGTATAVIVTAPANAAYVVMSYGRPMHGQMFVGLYEGSTAFFPFYEKISKKYIDYSAETPILNLPAKVYALVGYELNIYFENLTEKFEQYEWNVTCTKGMQLERGYRITPTADDVGSYTLTIRASASKDEYAEVTTILIVTGASAGSGVSKKVMVLGDSTTNNGIAVTKLNENFSNDVMNITTIGTRGASPNNHEGRSGWTFYSYFNPPNAGDIAAGVENPWYNPSTETFDAAYYFANSGIAKPDWLFINLGINDTFGYTADSNLASAITTIKGRCDTMIASILSASPSTKIGLCLTIPPNHSQDAFGKAYACGQTRDRYKRNNVIWVNDLIDEYDGRESDGIYLIPIYTNLDTIYNMGFETLPVNARNTDITYESPIGNGGVHPVQSGYWQIADVYTAFLKAQAAN